MLRHTTLLLAALAAAGLSLSSPAFAAVNEEAAKTLARDNNCFKCHAVSKDKDGPAYKKVAEKYRGKPDAVDKLVHHVTSGEKAKFADGHEEAHKVVKTDPANDAAQVRNLVEWILAQ